MRGETIYKILSLLEDVTANTADLAKTLIVSGYGANMNKIDREYKKIKNGRFEKQASLERKRKIEKYISKLKNDGLIVENSLGKLNLTKQGKGKLGKLKNSFLLNKSKYKKEKSGNIIVVSYDIPIVFNKERNILRDILKLLGFNLIHKSMWIGNNKLPRELFLELERMHILEYVEILEVTKSGSLKSLSQ